MTVDIHDQPPPRDPSLAELIAARPPLAMRAMDGLMLDGVALNAVADTLGTPTWVYSATTMRERLGNLAAALRAAGLNAQIRYAMKANDHLAVLRVFARAGAGADVVSEGEFLRAREAGIPASRIVFSGVGKTTAELRLAVAEEVGQINVESAEELHALSAIAAGMGRTARIALRVNPDVDAGTHSKITTGLAGNKFGVPYRHAAPLYASAVALPGLRLVGLAVHIGSQVLSLAPYRAAYARIAGLVRDLRAAGHAVSTVDCGGGLGIGYRNEPVTGPAALAATLGGAFHDLDVELIVEPGRWLVGPAGVLLASVILVKQGENRRFVVLDVGMNDLVRPAMYEAWHGIVPLSPVDAVAEVAPADVVGPVCESSDTFARNRLHAPLVGDDRAVALPAGPVQRGGRGRTPG